MNRKWLDGPVFPVLYFILTALSFNSLTAQYNYMSLLTVLVFVTGGIWGIYRLCCLKDYITMPYLAGWILFWLSYLVSSLLHLEYGILENVKALVWLGFQFFLLYPIRREKRAEEIRREFECLAIVVMAYSLIQAVISLVMLVLHVEGRGANGQNYGIAIGRLWGSYTDPNYGSLLACVSVAVSIYFMLRTKKMWIPSLVNIGFQILYIIYSYSRTGIVCLFVCGFVWLIFTGRKIWMRYGKKAGILVLIVVVCLSGSQICEGYTLTADVAVEKADRELGRVENLAEDISNGRFQIWESGLEIAKREPIFGISFRNIQPYAQEYLSDSYLVDNPLGAKFDAFHNVFVDVLVSQGIVGMGIWLTMIGLVFFRTGRFLWRRKMNVDAFVVLLLSLLLIIAVGALLLSEILYLNTPTSVVFWVSLGSLIGMIRHLDTKD